jgi:PKD repeat protein
MTIYPGSKETRLRIISRTKTIVILALAVAAAFPRQAAAQGPTGNIAYSLCSYIEILDEYFCYVGLAAADGSGNVRVADDGVNPALSRDGTKIAFVGYSQPGLFVYNLMDGSLVTIRNSAANWSQLTWSPDGTRLAFSADELYVMNADGSNVMQLTHNEGFHGRPTWSPDGTIAYECEVDVGNRDICAINADGTGFRRLTFDPAMDSHPIFSPDGMSIFFGTTRYSANLMGSLAVMNSNGTSVTQVGWTSAEALSPDGSRIASTGWSGGIVGACDASSSCDSHPTIFVSNLDGTDLREIAYGETASWGLSPRPFAQFESRGCNGLNCTLDGSRSWGGASPIMSYSWDFGDGTTGSGSTMTHVFPAAGTYIVKLTVTDAAGITGTQSQFLDVINNVWPTPRFTVSCIGWHCTFDGSGSSDPDGFIAHYDWIWGDGNYTGDAPAIADHTYRTAGPFTATLYVNDNRGARVGQPQVVTLPANVTPIASFTASCTGVTCTFDASGSSDPDGTITSYAWTFGDSTTGSGVTTSHTYGFSNTFTVGLVVTDNFGGAGLKSSSVTVTKVPIASFTATCTGLTCTFDGHGSSDPDGAITSYAWSFGDATSGSGVTTSHTYAASGTYTVGLVITDNIGGTGLKSSSVTVNMPPVPSFTATCTALACMFDGHGSSDPDGAITSYAWSFGDAATGSGVTASHTYAAAGTYAVALTVTDNAGVTGVRSATVTVTQLTIHIGDLDGARTNQQNSWTALVTITLHNGNHSPVANATVSGVWSIDGTTSCTTDSGGQCVISKSAIPRNTKSVKFTIANVTNSTFPYKSVDNHDPDGDSNGTTITVPSP